MRGLLILTSSQTIGLYMFASNILTFSQVVISTHHQCPWLQVHFLRSSVVSITQQWRFLLQVLHRLSLNPLFGLIVLY